jgi:hypothetical protein
LLLLERRLAAMPMRLLLVLVPEHTLDAYTTEKSCCHTAQWGRWRWQSLILAALLLLLLLLLRLLLLLLSDLQFPQIVM